MLAACAPAASGGASSTPAPTASSGGDAGSASVTEIPDETAGPYPGDGSNGPDVLEDSGIVRQDIRSSIDGAATADGVRLVFELQILDLANGGVPFAGGSGLRVALHPAQGYSCTLPGLEDVTYLRGVQVADDRRHGCRSPPSSPAATPVAGRTSTSRSTRRRVDHRLDDGDRHVAAGPSTGRLLGVYAESAYDGSARNLAQITLASDNVFGDDLRCPQVATVSGSDSAGLRRLPGGRRRHDDDTHCRRRARRQRGRTGRRRGAPGELTATRAGSRPEDGLLC